MRNSRFEKTKESKKDVLRLDISIEGRNYGMVNYEH